MKKLTAVLLSIATMLTAWGADSQPIYFTISPPVLPPGDMLTITASVVPPPGMRVVGIRLVLEPGGERTERVSVKRSSPRPDADAVPLSGTARSAEAAKPHRGAPAQASANATNAAPAVQSPRPEIKLVISPMTSDQLAERRAIIGFTLQRKRK